MTKWRFGRIPVSGRIGFLMVLLALTGPVAAHKVILIADAEGHVIRGRAYVSGSGPLRDVKVDVLDTDGNKIGESTTTAEGEFVFRPACRQDHTFVIDTGDGHRAQYEVAAEDLPADLPAARPGPSPTSTPAEKAATPATAPAGSAASPVAGGGDLRDIVEQAVARQIRPLNRKIEDLQEKIQLHDILGGIGYILGIMGVAFYFQARAKAKRAGG